MLNGKVMIIPLTVELIKKMSLYKSNQHFPTLFECSGRTGIILEIEGSIRQRHKRALFPYIKTIKGHLLFQQPLCS